MNGLLNSWYARAAIVGGLTWLAYKYLPVGSVGKTVTLAVGGVAAASIVASAVPLVRSTLAGQLPVMPAATTSNG